MQPADSNEQKRRLVNLLWLWLPVAVQMGLIFYFSAQPKGSPALESSPLPAGLGHLVGYAILGFLLYRAFNGGINGWSNPAGWKSFIVGLLYAVSDEIHQLYVPGREASVTDVGIDAAGLLLALTVIWVKEAVNKNIKG